MLSSGGQVKFGNEVVKKDRHHLQPMIDTERVSEGLISPVRSKSILVEIALRSSRRRGKARDTPYPCMLFSKTIPRQLAIQRNAQSVCVGLDDHL